MDIRDESDEQMRVVLEIKAGAEPEKIIAYLFKHSDMESNFQLNFTCLKPNGEPSRLSLLEICRHFLDFRKEVVVRRLNYELSIILKRLHILEAFAVIFNNLDKALKIIRSSKSRKEAADKLKNAFALDDEQVNAVLEIPLYRLVAMEIDKILEEKKEKLEEKKKIETILRSPAKIWHVVKEELQEIEKANGDKRKTKIKPVENIEYNEEDFIEHEDVVVVLSRNGWLRKFKTIGDPTSLKFKENDSLLGLVRANTRDCVAIFTSFGMVYVQRVLNLPYTRGGFGDPIQSLFNFGDGEKVIHILSLDPREIATSFNIHTAASLVPANNTDVQKSLSFGDEKDLEGMVASDSGYGFRFPLSNLTETTRSGKKVMSLKDNDRMVGMSVVNGSHVFLISADGKGMVIPIEEASRLSGTGMGVKLMKLVNSTLAGFKVVRPKDTVVLIFDDGTQKEVSLKTVPVYQRGSQGVVISKRKKVVNIL